jgi:hypothetical protein
MNLVRRAVPFLVVLSIATPASSMPAAAGVRIERATTKVVKPWSGPGLAEADLEAARNEWVAFQVVIAAGAEAMTGVTVALTDLAGPGGAVVPASGAELSLEWYHRVDLPSPCEYPFNFDCPDHPEYVRTPGDYPDALVPFLDPYGEAHAPVATPFDVAADDFQTVFVDLLVPAGTPPGDYAGDVRVESGGAPVAALPVKLHVWDVEIPAKRNVATAYGLWGSMWKFHATPDDATKARIQRNYELAMHRHRIDPTDQGGPVSFQFDGDGNLLPVDWTAYDAAVGPRIDGSYYGDGIGINRYNVGLFTPGHGKAGLTDAQWPKAAAAFAEHLQEKGFLDHAYMYSADEPWMPQHAGAIDAIAADVALLNEATSLWKGHVLVTGPWMEKLDEAVDIWCPVTAMYGDVSWPAGQWPDAPKYQELMAQGRELWFYVCNADFPPLLGYDLDSPYGWEPRIVKWRAWGEGATGFLFWSVTYWFDDDPWRHLANVEGFPGPFARNGDGVLFYPGDHKDGLGSPAGIAIDGPVASFRLKQVRDGIEDWELLLLADQFGGGKYAREQVDRAVTRFGDQLDDAFDPADRPWTLDEGVVQDARRNIAAKVQYLLHPDLYEDPEPPPVPEEEPGLEVQPEPVPEPVADEGEDCWCSMDVAPEPGLEDEDAAPGEPGTDATAPDVAAPDLSSVGGSGCAAGPSGGLAGVILLVIAAAVIRCRGRLA